MKGLKIVNLLYFDILSGASGDMLLASLIDCGVPIEYIQQNMGRLPLKGISIDCEKTKRNGIACTHLIITQKKEKTYRHLPEILEIIDPKLFPEAVVSQCTRIFTRLAEAEARVHGIPVDKVHFHEVGAVDTIIDILGVCLCFDYLKVDEIYYSTLTVGQGTVQCEHGIMPVPAPATAEMIKGLNVCSIDVHTEILTPTGAAILTTVGKQCRGLPTGSIGNTGYGCGTRTFKNHPNILRNFLIQTAESDKSEISDEEICMLESDMDHISGETMGFVSEQLFEAGALDVCWIPVCMKKGRPAYRLSVLCEKTAKETLLDRIFFQTRTLGVRYRFIKRRTAQRKNISSSLLNMETHSKECSYKGKTFTKIEYESLAECARKSDRPLPELAEEYIRQQKTDQSS
ncbi:MAG: nickel pincer cofactor biosynthesis protein LarC [Chitinivibrionales bacterium]|nr:nickel pincer cofactor biosynthesis protein LarC [Chitinivibrionales bacterium]